MCKIINRYEACYLQVIQTVHENYARTGPSFLMYYNKEYKKKNKSDFNLF